MGVSMQSATVILPLWIQVALAVVPAIGLLCAAGGLFLNVAQSRRTNAQARSALVAGCLKDFADDEQMQEAFYSIEYANFRYDEQFHGSATERSIDKLLRHFSNTALAWQAGLLKAEDVRPIKYYVVRIMGNIEIQRYMAFMEQWTDNPGMDGHPYLALLALYRKMIEWRPTLRSSGLPTTAAELQR